MAELNSAAAHGRCGERLAGQPDRRPARGGRGAVASGGGTAPLVLHADRPRRPAADPGSGPPSRARPCSWSRRVCPRPGFVTVSTIMGLENVLDQLEGWGAGWDRERGRDPQLYYLRVFGEPSAAGPWSWRFGGHHVSVHHLVVDGAVARQHAVFSWARTRPSRRCWAGTCCGRWARSRIWPGSWCGRWTTSRPRRAVISPVPPVDIVGGNRPRVREGDVALPLGDVWRGRFADSGCRTCSTRCSAAQSRRSDCGRSTMRRCA